MRDKMYIINKERFRLVAENDFRCLCTIDTDCICDTMRSTGRCRCGVYREVETEVTNCSIDGNQHSDTVVIDKPKSGYYFDIIEHEEDIAIGEIREEDKE